MNLSCWFKKNDNNLGSIATEFVLVFPIMLLILFAIIEFGRIMAVKNTVTSAAREGARNAILPGATYATVLAKINGVLSEGNLTANTIEVIDETSGTVVNVLTAIDRGDPVTVKVVVHYDMLTGLFGMFPGGMDLQGEVTMRREYL